MVSSAATPKWVTAQPEPVLATLETSLRDRAGAVLIGPAGVGKTTLARAAASRLGSQFGGVDWVIATTPAAAVPFAAFGHLIDVPDSGKTAEVLRAARESLGDGRLLVVVDDAHLLDKLSAALVYQLAVSGAAKLIVTVAPNGPVAEEISALWRDDLLERIDLKPAGHDDSQVATLVGEFVAALPAAAHRVLEYLAVDDPLPRAEIVALVGRDAVAEATASGAIVVDDEQVRPAHPRHGLKSMLFAPELALARAWTMSARRARGGRRGTRRGAQRRARWAVSAAGPARRRAAWRHSRGRRHRASHRGSRLRVGQLALAHARALVGRDAVALGDVSARLAAIGMNRAAADAAAQAR